MSTPLVIAESGAASASASAMNMTAEEHAAMTPEEGAAMDQAMIDSVLAFPAETKGRGNQVLEPEILADGTKHFDLTASIIDWEVSPGKVVQAWAYNGMVPGPRINLDVGDRVRGADHERAADRHRHPLARHRRPERPGRRGTDHPGHDRAAARPTRTASRRRSRRSACTTPTPTASRRSPTGCSARSTSATSPLPAGRTIVGHRRSPRPHDRPGHPDGAQRRRRHRAHASTPRASRRPSRSWSTRAIGSG